MADITREDALALLGKQDINEIIKPATFSSAALQAFRNVRMTAGTASMPVLAALPTAGWVGESATDPKGVKPSSNAKWLDKKLVAEEIAVIVPIHENLLADSKFDIWAEIQPLVSAEFGRVLDLAVFQGVNKPTSWTDEALIPGAIAAGNTIEEGTGIDLADDFNEAFGLVEDDEFDVNAAFTGKFLRSELRGLRDANNQPIYLDALRSDNDTASIYGQNLHYVVNRAWDRTKALALVGDRSKVVLGIREDMQVKLLDQATLGTGANQINLAERDMVALRFKFRVGYATAYSTAGFENGTSAYPFAVITPSAGEPAASLTDSHTAENPGA